ncbi:hypothetical protein L3X38_024867 [Prunus dulcis]|uniref:Uncharacterized protein n=1 Tax=Prunus dulcis TaxID=3755 RepID=A0AAD4Z6X2_PRUDU|nr:hypothetical protein L3X38_024867 [Prunus dulcis]
MEVYFSAMIPNLAEPTDSPELPQNLGMDHNHHPTINELTKQLPRVVTHPGIAPASNSLNFGVPTTPKPVSSQKASRYEDASELPKGLAKVRVAQRTTQTLPSMILSALGWADAPPHRFVPGSSQSSFPGWSPILGLL